ncbi:hypothetical protein V8F06_013747 [Rhypophila decipiens]
MCHTIHYTDRDKTELCEDGRLGMKCKLTEEWVTHSRKHALAKLDLTKIESAASLAERLPTPYAHLPLSSSPNRDGPGVYVNGTKVVELSKPRKHRDQRADDYDYRYERRSSRYHDSDPRDRDDDRRGRDPTLKRSSTMPYVVIQQEKNARRRSTSRDDPVVKEYTRRRRSRSRSRSRSRDRNPTRGVYYRQHTADGYIVVDDGEKERRRRRRGSVDYAAEPRSTAEVRYTPHRASTIIHRSDGTTLETKRSPKPKQVAWDDEVRVKRDKSLDARQAQNIKIASRPKQRADPDRDPRLKGILKNSDANAGSKAKTYREESEDRRREEIRRAVEQMGIQTSSSRDRERGRGREPQEWDEQVERLRTRLGDVKFDDREERRKRSKVWIDDRFVYR